jgi:hypothetical protein
MGKSVRPIQIDKVDNFLLPLRRQALHFGDRSLDQTHFYAPLLILGR